MLRVRTLLTWLMMCTAAFGLPHTEIRLIDTSSLDSPVKLSGVATFSDEPSKLFRYEYKTTAYVNNVSQKSVLLLVARVRFTGAGGFDLDNAREDDYFFAEDLLGAGKTQTLKDSFGPASAPQAKTALATTDPQATASVLFVQFIDGSTWGELAAGKHMLEIRSLTWEKLRSLAETYRTNGEGQFLLALSRYSDLPAVASLQRTYESTKDSRGVVAKMTNMLRYADMHAKEARLSPGDIGTHSPPSKSRP